MRVLLDECVPRRLKHELPGYEARTAPEMGWASKRNGELLTLAVGAEFDALVTVDRNLSCQHDVSAFDIAVVVLVVRSNTLDWLRPLVPRLLRCLETAERRRVTVVRSSDV